MVFIIEVGMYNGAYLYGEISFFGPTRSTKEATACKVAMGSRIPSQQDAQTPAHPLLAQSCPRKLGHLIASRQQV